ncbi:FG-GAP-like repeat-containing protein [Myxococcota bacterium]|nr:FG-GAP-like repeat-containing protein [Myxococcota bacterium]
MRDLRVWALWAVVCAVAGCGDPSPPAGAPAEDGAPASASWQQVVQRRIAAGSYAFAAQGERAYRFRNRAQGLAGEVAAEGARVRAGQGDGGEPVTVGLVAWGGDGGVREARGSAPELGECRSDGEVDARGECLRRVEVARDGVTEWWENGIRGLEHGFVVVAPPDGSGTVVLEVGVTGAVARVEGSGTAARLEVPGGTDLRYSGLRAWDATGRDLASRMEGTAGGVRLRVETAGAVYPVTVDPLLSAVAWTAASDQASARFGFSVSSAGDVNGDGYGDVVVGAPYYDGGESYEGAAFLYLGSSSGLSASASWTAESDQASALFGTSVSSAGDVNGDGYADVVVGALGYSNGEASEGAAFVYLGSPSGLSASASWTAEPDQASARFGSSVSSAGDVNGDGYADVVVGAYDYDNGETNEGAAFLYLGSSSGLSASASWTAESDQASASFGRSVSSAGDVNGDGYGDVVVGARDYDNGETNEGAAFLYLGSPMGLSASASWTAESDQATGYFGYSVSSAGDVNGDGYADVVVGASAYSDGESFEGAAFLYLGSPSGLSASASWTAESDQANAYFGTSVSSAGDVNGDGYGDVVVGAYAHDQGETDEGGAFLYLGSSSGLSASASWTAESDQESTSFGYSVSSAGDVNGDGYADVVVGAYRYDNGEIDEGAASLYLGNGGDGVGPGTSLVPQARRVGETTPVVTGGFSGTDGAFDVAATGRSGIGRGRVKLQVEAKPLGIPFDGTGFVEGSAFTDTGVGGTELQVTVGGLDDTESYHWRARLLEDPSTASPQGWSRWLWGGVYGEAGGTHVLTGSADEDGDGWSVWSGDCDDADPASFPGAVEVCGDAVDQDCDGTADDGCGADCSISPIGPADGADLTAGPTFIWSGDCDGYRVEISPYDGFPANEVYVFGNFADDLADNSFSPSASLWSAIGRAFTVEGFWRVVGGLDGLTVASAPRSFYTTHYPLPTPPAPVPGCTVSQGSPADGATILSPPTFVWTTDCTGAYLEVSSDPDFALESTYYFGAVSGGHYTMSSTIWNALDGHFVGSAGYWRVTAGAAEGDVTSGVRSFSVP